MWRCGYRLFITAAIIDSWATDGIVEIELRPNIPNNLSGEFAVNAICLPQSTVEASLSLESKELSGYRLEYAVNAGSRQSMNAVGLTATTLEQGSNQIQYFVTDCAGNIDSCSFNVQVMDMEAPDLSCPPDMIVDLETGECTIDLTLPLTISATDNCAVGGYLASNCLQIPVMPFLLLTTTLTWMPTSPMRS